MQRILMLIVAFIALGVPAADFGETAFTAARWQAEAQASYNRDRAAFDAWQTSVRPEQPEPWVEASPLTVAAGVWKAVGGNLSSTGGGLFLLVQLVWGLFKGRTEPRLLSDSEALKNRYLWGGMLRDLIDRVAKQPKGGSGVPK